MTQKETEYIDSLHTVGAKLIGHCMYETFGPSSDSDDFLNLMEMFNLTEQASFNYQDRLKTKPFCSFFDGSPEEVQSRFATLPADIQTGFRKLIFSPFVTQDDLPACFFGAQHEFLLQGRNGWREKEFISVETNPPFFTMVPLLRRGLQLALSSPYGEKEARTEKPSSFFTNEENIDGKIYALQVNLQDIPLSVDYSKFTKTELKKFNSECAIPTFPIGDGQGVSPTQLLIITLKFFEKKIDNQKEIIDQIADLMNLIFPPNWDKPMLVDHEQFFYLRKGIRGITNKSPSLGGYSRLALRSFLQEAAQSDEWYDAGRLYQWFSTSGREFSFDGKSELKVEAQSITWKGTCYESPYHNYPDFFIGKGLQEIMLYRPLFKAFLYLLAAFGILEITEKKVTELPITRASGRTVPWSIYEAIDAVHFTALGHWIFGSGEKPAMQGQRGSQVILDDKLLLITFKGHDVKKEAFLKKIGIPMGSERYRVTKASFVSSCIGSTDEYYLEKEFKELFPEELPLNWIEFFHLMSNNSLLFSVPDDALVYTIDDPKQLEEVMQQKAFSDCFIKAEGNRLVVLESKRKQAFALLKSYGIIPFGMEV